MIESDPGPGDLIRTVAALDDQGGVEYDDEACRCCKTQPLILFWVINPEILDDDDGDIFYNPADQVWACLLCDYMHLWPRVELAEEEH